MLEHVQRRQHIGGARFNLLLSKPKQPFCVTARSFRRQLSPELVWVKISSLGLITVAVSFRLGGTNRLRERLDRRIDLDVLTGRDVIPKPALHHIMHGIDRPMEAKVQELNVEATNRIGLEVCAHRSRLVMRKRCAACGLPECVFPQNQKCNEEETHQLRAERCSAVHVRQLLRR